MDTTEKTSLKTIRFSATEARLLERSAAERNMSVSDVVRQAVVDCASATAIASRRSRRGRQACSPSTGLMRSRPRA